MELDELSNRVIGCAVEVHRELGPGLLEPTYEQCLPHELKLNGILFKLQHPQPAEYKAVRLDSGYRVDLLVEYELIISEGVVNRTSYYTPRLKNVDQLKPIHEAQLLTYMKLAGVRTGLLMNFNVKKLKSGTNRFVL